MFLETQLKAKLKEKWVHCLDVEKRGCHVLQPHSEEAGVEEP